MKTKETFLYLCLMLSCQLQAQMIVVAPEKKTRNENGYYMNLQNAKENATDVWTLDIQKEDADKFLSNPDTFPNLNELIVNFSKVKTINNLAACRNLKEIKIFYSWNIASLPDDLIQLPLENLIFEGGNLKHLPGSFFYGKTFKRICLGHNQLDSLPEIPKNNNITNLYLCLNKFSKLPSDFKNLQKLEVLSLKDNAFFEFPKEILTLKNLNALNLSANNISEIPKKLNNLSKLETLYLVRTSVKKLPSLKKTSLKLLLISDTGLSEKEKENIKNALPENCEINWTDELNQSLDSFSCSCVKMSYF